MRGPEDSTKTSIGATAQSDPSEVTPDSGEGAEKPEPRSFSNPESQTTVIGVSRAGKTFLLAALQQACMLSGGNGYQLSFMPLPARDAQSKPTSKLIREVIDRIVTGDTTLLKSDLSVSRYSFQLECQSSLLHEPLWMGRAKAITMTMVDGPGGSLFPHRSRMDAVQHTEERQIQREMIQSIRSSANLVICIDSVSPHLTAFRREFSQLLEQATGGPRQKLGAQRLLLLFTKVDAAVDRVMASLGRTRRNLAPGERPTRALRLLVTQNSVTERKLAELIDPLELARSTLDQASLSLIRRSLTPQAQMAVGVCSSTGFYEDGSSFWDDSESRIRPRKGQSWDDPLRDWTPFGVEEAMLFLLTGRTGATLRNYSAAQDQLASNAKRQNQLRLTLR